MAPEADAADTELPQIPDPPAPIELREDPYDDGSLDDDDDDDLVAPADAVLTPNPDEADGPDDPPEENTAKKKADALAAADSAAQSVPAQPPGGVEQPCPLKSKEWIQVKVLGDDDQPVRDVRVRIAKSDGGMLMGRTRADGIILFQGIPAGSYRILFPVHDGSLWDFSKSGAPATPPPTPGGAATWYAEPADDAPTQHEVEEGESITTIAQRFGYAADYLFNHASNADLKTLRVDPRTLVPGDVVALPPRVKKDVSKPNGQEHTFKLHGVPARLRLQIKREGVARANEDYLLDLDGQTVTGKTDKDGFLSVPVDPGAVRGRLVIGPDTYDLQLGYLQPANTLRGAQQRLANLGYTEPPYEDELGDATRTAILAFQADFKLTASGALDDDTQTKLKQAYGDA